MEKTIDAGALRSFEEVAGRVDRVPLMGVPRARRLGRAVDDRADRPRQLDRSGLSQVAGLIVRAGEPVHRVRDAATQDQRYLTELDEPPQDMAS